MEAKSVYVHTPLIVPRFHDEDDSNSSESDDDEPAITCINPRNKQQDWDPRYDNNDNQNASDGDHLHPTTRVKATWSRVQSVQDPMNANASVFFEARDLRQQVKALQIQLEAQAPVPGLDVGAVQDILLEKDNVEHDVRDVKIIHQAKNVRALKRSLQREKQLAAGAIKQCKELEAVNKQLNEEVDTLKLKLQRFQARATADASNSNGQPQRLESPTCALSDASKDNGAMKKLHDELKLKNGALQQELKKIQRVLVREVGDDVPLEEILGSSDNNASGASRRGRAQQIIMLKAKVKKLEAQLAMVQPEIGAQDSTTTAPVLDVDQRAQQDLSGQHMHRQKLLDQLTNQRDELQERVHQSTRKYDALKARALILDREKQETRRKLQVLVDKSRTDDALVDALQRQLETWKSKLSEAKRARTADSIKGSTSHEERAELARLRTIVAEYKSRGNDGLAVNSMGPSRGGMPVPSELSQYRAITAEKERLAEVVRDLNAQLEDKKKQIQNLHQSSGNSNLLQVQTTSSSSTLPLMRDESISHIPRFGSKIPMPSGRTNRSLALSRPAPSASIVERQQQQLQCEMETLRQTFRASIREKDDRIAELERQQQVSSQSTSSVVPGNVNGMAQELQDLQEENDFLRQEFDKLKVRYEALTKPNDKRTKSGKQRNEEDGNHFEMAHKEG